MMSLKGGKSAVGTALTKPPIEYSIGGELKNTCMYFCKKPYSILSMAALIPILSTLKRRYNLT